MRIDFNNGITTPLNTPDTLTIEEMNFYRSNMPLFLYVGIAYLCYAASVIIIVRKRTRSEKNSANEKMYQRVIPYEKIDLMSNAESDLEKLVLHIAAHFSDPELSVQKVAAATGLSIYKIPALLKERYSYSFKEYINKIRIEEAKRLLSSSDRRISEIAYSVGYNSAPHFNRLFKELVGKSPREHRDESAK